MEGTNRIPDFFVIGAPRCGTTAISKYLSNNPNICFSRPREPHFFSITLHEKPDSDIQSDYLNLFFPIAARSTRQSEKDRSPTSIIPRQSGRSSS